MDHWGCPANIPTLELALSIAMVVRIAYVKWHNKIQVWMDGLETLKIKLISFPKYSYIYCNRKMISNKNALDLLGK